MKTYVVKEEGTLFCKIGKSARPLERMPRVQCGNPRRLGFVAVFKGDVESRLHAHFEEQHIALEWFELTPEQIDELAAMGEKLPDAFGSEGEAPTYTRHTRRDDSTSPLIDRLRKQLAASERHLKLRYEEVELLRHERKTLERELDSLRRAARGCIKSMLKCADIGAWGQLMPDNVLRHSNGRIRHEKSASVYALQLWADGPLEAGPIIRLIDEAFPKGGDQ